MLLSQDFKDFASFICPVLTMIGVIVTLIVTIQINKEVLMGVKDMQQQGGCGDVAALK
jgi:hypothetical protein